ARELSGDERVERGGAGRIDASGRPGPNGAATAPDSGSAPAPPAPASPPTGSPATGSGRSRNWAGYAASGGTFTAVSGGWTVPQTPVTGSVRRRAPRGRVRRAGPPPPGPGRARPQGRRRAPGPPP